MQEILLWAFVILGSVNFLHLAMYIVGANIYDIKKFRQDRQAPKRRKEKRPLVSVVIPAHNEELTIERCLDSIRRNSYRKIEVFVHNDCSSDDTAFIVRDYQKRHPKMKLKLITRRRNVGKAEGVNFCIRRYAKGSLVMTLDADCVLDPRAIKRAVDYFDDPTIVGVAANVRIMEDRTVLGLLQRFEHMIGYRTKKFYTIANCEFVVGGVASTYRREVLQAVKWYDTDTQTEDIGLSMKIMSQGNRDQRIIYAADVVASTEPVQTFQGLLTQRYRWKLGMIQNLLKYRRMTGNLNRRYSKSLTLYRMPMAFFSELNLMFEPFLLGYLLYLSIVYRTGALFIGAYIALTAYIMLTIWPDEHSSIWRKATLTLYAPIMYFIFYIMDLIQVVAIFRVLTHPRKVLRKTPTGSSWISPKRLGQNVDAA